MTTGVNAFGKVLRRWREIRRISQLELALEASVSAKHISFIETGRSIPSREMIISLSTVLDLPLRERNEMLLSAGYAPVYRETSLNHPQMSHVRQALSLILARQEPFGAIVFDHQWNLIMANKGYLTIISLILGKESKFTPYTVMTSPRLNLVKLLFDPNRWRPYIVNWEDVAKAVLRRLHREAFRECDVVAKKLLDSALSYPNVPTKWREHDCEFPQDLIIPLVINIGNQQLRLFSTFTSMGSPQDITLQELHIESFHPADKETEEIVFALTQKSTY